MRAADNLPVFELGSEPGTTHGAETKDVAQAHEPTFSLSESKTSMTETELESKVDKEIFEYLTKLHQKNPDSKSILNVKENLAFILSHPQKKQFYKALKYWVEQGPKDVDFKIHQYDFDLLKKNPREALSIAKINCFFFEHEPDQELLDHLMANISNSEFIRAIIGRLNFLNESTSILKHPLRQGVPAQNCDIYSQIIMAARRETTHLNARKLCFCMGIFGPQKKNANKEDANKKAALEIFRMDPLFDRRVLPLIFDFASASASLKTSDKPKLKDPFENPYDDHPTTADRRLRRSKSF